MTTIKTKLAAIAFVSLVTLPAFAGKGGSNGAILQAVQSGSTGAIIAEVERTEGLMCDACIQTVTSLTEDSQVFAVLGTFYDPSGDGQICVAGQHHRVLLTFDLTQAIMDKSPAGLIVNAGSNPERLVRVRQRVNRFVGRRGGGDHGQQRDRPHDAEQADAARLQRDELAIRRQPAQAQQHAVEQRHRDRDAQRLRHQRDQHAQHDRPGHPFGDEPSAEGNGTTVANRCDQAEQAADQDSP